MIATVRELSERQASTSTGTSTMTNSPITYTRGTLVADWRLLWACLRVLSTAFVSPPISAATRSISAWGLGWGTMVQPHLQRLAELSAVEENWDSYGGHPPSAQSLERARRFLLAVVAQYGDVYGAAASPFIIVPLAAGGLQLQWRGPGGELELEIGPQEELGFLLIRGHGESRRFEEGELDSETAALGLVGRVLFPATAA